MPSNNINGQPEIANITVVTDERQIIVPQAITSVVEVNSPGPQGPIGPQGIAGPSEPFINIGNGVYATTSSLEVSGSFLVSGSSTFTNIGPAIFSGSVDVTSGVTMSSAIVSGDVTVLGTASISTLQINNTLSSTGSISGGSFIKIGGTNSQFLKADGSVDSSSYTPTSRTITINGTTQDLSADRSYTIATGLAIGTTPITSGTIGRVLFEGTGNVLQQSANLFWDNVNGRLGIGTSTPASRLQVKSSGTNTDVVSILNTSDASLFRIFNGGGGQAIVDIGGSVFLRSDASLSYINSGGNFAIGTSTDAGFKLDVNGNTRIIGSGATSSTNALIIQNSGTTTLFYIDNSGQAFFNNRIAVNRIQPLSSANIVEIAGGIGSATGGSGIGLNQFTNVTNTSGTHNRIESTGAFLPVSGTGVFNAFQIAGTINQTGGANGITRGLFINPTLTAAADFRAIENSVGKVCLNTTSGNTMIGTTTDAGFKLDVNGTARVSGQLTVTGNYIQYGTNPNVGIGATNNGTAFVSVGPSLLYATANVNTLAIYGHNYFTGNYNAASGIQGAVGFVGATFNPTSGTAVFNTMNITATINQTGGANGITRGLFINPTLTAAADFRAIENSVGKVCLNTTSGNTMIGTTTDAGFKLDVNGTARVQNDLTVSNRLQVQNGLWIDFGAGAFSRKIFGQSGLNLNFQLAHDGGVFNFISWASPFTMFSIGTSGMISGVNFGFNQSSPTALADIGASTTAKSSLRIRSGVAPTSPNDGDIWFDGTDIKMRIGGVTKTFTLI